jgi:hypothetical protein
MCSIWGRCVTHLYTSSKQSLKHSLLQSPESAASLTAFWTCHYEIDTAVTQARTGCCAHLTVSGPFAADPNVLSLNLLACSATICLFTTAVRQAEVTGLPPGANAEIETKCAFAAMEIAAIVQLLPSPEMLTKVWHEFLLESRSRTPVFADPLALGKFLLRSLSLFSCTCAGAEHQETAW